MFKPALLDSVPRREFCAAARPHRPDTVDDASNRPPETREDRVWRWSYASYLTKKDLLVFKEAATSPLQDQDGKQARWNVYTKYYPEDRLEDGIRPRDFIDRVTNDLGTKALIALGMGKYFDFAGSTTSGANLHDVSAGIEACKGLFITDIDANRDVIELSNGDVVVAGQLADRDVTEETKRRIQIREVIRAHLDKERALFAQDIKVLSLFFIDKVAKYRDYAREDNLGDYALVFEEEYTAIVQDILGELELDDATSAYQDYLRRDEVRKVHQGYFSIDKKTKHQVDPTIAKRGEDAGQSTDVDAYDLILKDKERLLSFAEPVRFLFSHSALREGWDNPNVFVMGMLKKSDNTVSRRQEIGRGLRLAVDQHGDRMDNPVTVHDVIELTVVTDESYTDFVAGLQKEIAESLAARPRKASVKFFVGNPEQFITATARLINEQKATVIVEHLAYDALDDRYDSAIFTENQTRQDLTHAGGKLNKHIYDYVVTDSKIERAFVTELDTSQEVAVYAKLPRGFFIPTPVGDYNPDWAIAFTEGSVKHVYFVAETKGSLSTLQLKGVEDAKIECARKFFASLTEKQGQDVKYDVVSDYTELMQLVAG